MRLKNAAQFKNVLDFSLNLKSKYHEAKQDSAIRAKT